MKIQIKEGYRGMCSRCMEKDGKFRVWFDFSNPIPAQPEHGLPEVKGLWEYVCNECLRPDDKRGED